MKNDQQRIQPADLYFTIPQFARRHAAFGNGSLRWLVYNAEKNGLAKSGAIIRIGRKVLIDEALFLKWVKSQNQAPA